MINYFSDFFILTLGWLLMFFSYNGWGSVFIKAAKLQFDDPESIFLLSWVGWSLSIFIFNIYNLIFPVNIYFSSIYFGTGIILYFLRNRKSRGLRQAKAYILDNLIPLTIFLLIAIWLASRSMLAPTAYDSGLYHFNSIRWLNEYAIVPGLGNLHGRLAFNQSFFIYVASINFYPYLGYGHNLANSFIIILLMSEYIRCTTSYMRSLKSGKNLFEVNGTISLYFVAVLLFMIGTSPVSSPTPDIASSVLQLLLFTHLIRLLYNYENNANMLSRTAFITILAATAVTIKLSNIIFAGLVVIVALFYLVYSIIGISKKINIRPLVYSIIIACLIMIIWASRGVIYSGYPAYPSTIGRITTEWTIPVEAVRIEANWVYSWARQPGVHPDVVLNNWNWLSSWYRLFIQNKIGIVYIFLSVLSLGMILAAVILSFIKKRQVISLIRIRSFVPLLTVLTSLIFWFLTAPAIRFANAHFFLLPITSFLVLRDQLFDEVIQFVWEMRKKLIVFGFAIITGFLLYFIFIVMDGYKPRSFIFLGGIEPITTVLLEQRETTTGVKVWLPINGDQCWDSPLPSAPYLNPKMDYRGYSIQEGFVLRY